MAEALSSARAWAARGLELAMIVVGLFFAIGEWTVRDNVRLMLAWAVLAGVYLLTGLVIARRSRYRDDGRIEAPPSALGMRWRFVFTLAASLTGLGAAAIAIVADDYEDVDGYGSMKGMAVLIMILAWLLLHSGYARFYAAVYARDGGRGLDFPGTPRPGMVEMLYFALTVGTTFAASDVDVTSRSMRWHVLVHGVIAFFYNAAILALAIGVVTGK